MIVTRPDDRLAELCAEGWRPKTAEKALPSLWKQGWHALVTLARFNPREGRNDEISFYI